MGYHTQLTSYLTHPITDTENGEGGSVRQAQEASVRLLPVDERRGPGGCQEEEPRREHHGGEQGVRGHVGQDRRAQEEQQRQGGRGSKESCRPQESCQGEEESGNIGG